MNTHSHQAESGKEIQTSEPLSSSGSQNSKDHSSKHWLSLEQWQNDPQFQKQMEQEFLTHPVAPEEYDNPVTGGWARREFLKLMGASVALTSFGCARRTAQKIVPYAKRPEGMVPGIMDHYSSTLIDGQEGFGTIMSTREGRPIKIEGNPSHPVNQGKMSARAHAHILSLYDPDRLGSPQKNEGSSFKKMSWEDVDKEVAPQFKSGGVALLTGSLVSPSTQSLISEFTKWTKGKHYQWEAVDYSAQREAQALCYGDHVMPRPRWNQVKYFVSVGADFLGTHLSPTEATKGWSETRRPGSDMSEMVVFEPLLSLTGANADQRFRVKSTEFLTVVMGLLHELVMVQGHSKYSTDSKVKGLLSPYKEAAQTLGVPADNFSEVASDLWKNRGKSLVLSGGVVGQTEDALPLQVATNFLNSVLENDGATIDYKNVVYNGYNGSSQGVQSLISQMKNGKIKTLVIHGVNPVYVLPENSGFKEALKKVNTVIYYGDRMDETGPECHYILADNHSLENWGDSEIQSGVFTIQQPTIRPLNETRSFQDSLILWAQAQEATGNLVDHESWYAYVKNYWEKNIFSKHSQVLKATNFESFWGEALQKGVVDSSSQIRNSSLKGRSFRVSEFLSSLAKVSPTGSQNGDNKALELVLYTKAGVLDGTLANVPWLQELPDPVTKLCWENYLCVSVKTAEEMGLKEGQYVKIDGGNRSVEAPVHIQPGLHDGVVGLALGYGRKGAGSVADGVGVNAYSLAQWKTGSVVYSGTPVKLQKLDRTTQLASPQGHHSMEGRQIVVEATRDQYLKNPSANIHKHHVFSLWDKHEYPGHKWGMTVDLNQCTGCSACVIACQSENNSPTIGKKYVLEGRIMHWIRIDRYYAGDAKNPDSLHMPVMCQHCDNAPCETVCPVLATVHGPEGTNDMIYNRCVGTRYCLNNCPYKVRRFNWFNQHKDLKAPQEMAFNPEVTVRKRGVMEKCTFCLHRIKKAKQTAAVEGRKTLNDGEVQTACEQSCPAQAITFGDMNNPQSRLSQSLKDKRSYALLEELNNVPAVTYQSKIRNTAHLKSHYKEHESGVGHDKSPEDGHHKKKAPAKGHEHAPEKDGGHA